MFADRALLIGDTAADLLLEYAAALSSAGQVDTVRLHAISPQRTEVEAGLLLDSATTLMIETTNTVAEEPANTAAEHYMQERIHKLTHASLTSPFSADDLKNVDPSVWD